MPFQERERFDDTDRLSLAHSRNLFPILPFRDTAAGAFDAEGECKLDFGDQKIFLKPGQTRSYRFRYQSGVGIHAVTAFGLWFYSQPPTVGLESPNRITDEDDLPDVQFFPAAPEPDIGDWQDAIVTITTEDDFHGQIYGLLFMC